MNYEFGDFRDFLEPSHNNIDWWLWLKIIIIYVSSDDNEYYIKMGGSFAVHSFQVLFYRFVTVFLLIDTNIYIENIV